MKITLLITLLFPAFLLSAQSDTARLRAVENKLKNKATVSSILVDKNYLDLHPLTSLR